MAQVSLQLLQDDDKILESLKMHRCDSEMLQFIFKRQSIGRDISKFMQPLISCVGKLGRFDRFIVWRIFQHYPVQWADLRLFKFLIDEIANSPNTIKIEALKLFPSLPPDLILTALFPHLEQYRDKVPKVQELDLLSLILQPDGLLRQRVIESLGTALLSLSSRILELQDSVIDYYVERFWNHIITVLSFDRFSGALRAALCVVHQLICTSQSQPLNPDLLFWVEQTVRKVMEKTRVLSIFGALTTLLEHDKVPSIQSFLFIASYFLQNQQLQKKKSKEDSEGLDDLGLTSGFLGILVIKPDTLLTYIEQFIFPQLEVPRVSANVAYGVSRALVSCIAPSKFSFPPSWCELIGVSLNNLLFGHTICNVPETHENVVLLMLEAVQLLQHTSNRVLMVTCITNILKKIKEMKPIEVVHKCLVPSCSVLMRYIFKNGSKANEIIDEFFSQVIQLSPIAFPNPSERSTRKVAARNPRTMVSQPLVIVTKFDFILVTGLLEALIHERAVFDSNMSSDVAYTIRYVHTELQWATSGFRVLDIMCSVFNWALADESQCSTFFVYYIDLCAVVFQLISRFEAEIAAVTGRSDLVTATQKKQIEGLNNELQAFLLYWSLSLGEIANIEFAVALSSLLVLYIPPTATNEFETILSWLDVSVLNWESKGQGFLNFIGGTGKAEHPGTLVQKQAASFGGSDGHGRRPQLQNLEFSLRCLYLVGCHCPAIVRKVVTLFEQLIKNWQTNQGLAHLVHTCRQLKGNISAHKTFYGARVEKIAYWAQPQGWEEMLTLNESFFHQSVLHRVFQSSFKAEDLEDKEGKEVMTPSDPISVHVSHAIVNHVEACVKLKFSVLSLSEIPLTNVKCLVHSEGQLKPTLHNSQSFVHALLKPYESFSFTRSYHVTLFSPLDVSVEVHIGSRELPRSARRRFNVTDVQPLLTYRSLPYNIDVHEFVTPFPMSKMAFQQQQANQKNSVAFRVSLRNMDAVTFEMSNIKTKYYNVLGQPYCHHCQFLFSGLSSWGDLILIHLFGQYLKPECLVLRVEVRSSWHVIHAIQENKYRWTTGFLGLQLGAPTPQGQQVSIIEIHPCEHVIDSWIDSSELNDNSTTTSTPVVITGSSSPKPVHHDSPSSSSPKSHHDNMSSSSPKPHHHEGKLQDTWRILKAKYPMPEDLKTWGLDPDIVITNNS